MLRSIGAVIAGFVVMAITVMIGTFRLSALLLSGATRSGGALPPGRVVPPAYLTANLVLSFLAAVLGSWVTTLIAGSAPMTHAAALAALVFVMGLVSARQAGSAGHHAGQPTWYPWVITTIGIAGVLAGGLLRT